MATEVSKSVASATLSSIAITPALIGSLASAANAAIAEADKNKKHVCKGIKQSRSALRWA